MIRVCGRQGSTRHNDIRYAVLCSTDTGMSPKLVDNLCRLTEQYFRTVLNRKRRVSEKCMKGLIKYCLTKKLSIMEIIESSSVGALI